MTMNGYKNDIIIATLNNPNFFKGSTTEANIQSVTKLIEEVIKTLDKE